MNMKKRLVACLVIVALLCSSLLPAAAAEETDLLVNGGFETGDSTGWNWFNNAVVDSAAPHSGNCALPGFVDSKNEEKTERNAGYLVVSQSGGGMLRQGTRKGIRRTPANRGMRAHRIVKGLDISEDVCHGMCP